MAIKTATSSTSRAASGGGKVRLVHVCSECGTSHPKWTGQCSGCGEWNTLVEDVEGSADVLVLPSNRPGPARIGDIDDQDGHPAADRHRRARPGARRRHRSRVGHAARRRAGHRQEHAAAAAARVVAGPTLYVSAEESAQQVRLRAERLGAVRADLWLHAETSLPTSSTAIADTTPELVVVDSIQTIARPVVGVVARQRRPGARVRPAARGRGQAARRRRSCSSATSPRTAALAGPRVLEHVVDTVLSFEGERHHALRLLRASKHRFGSTDELGLFEMTDDGLAGVPDPSTLFLADRRVGVRRLGRRADDGGPAAAAGRGPGAHRAGASGRRRHGATPKGSTAAGWRMLLAVLERRVGIAVGEQDVYASTVGGVRLSSPASTSACASPWPAPSIDTPLPPTSS